MATNIELARAAKMRPIQEIALDLGIPPGDVHQYGPWKAKISLDHIAQRANGRTGKLILVTAMTPTPAGEGKSTTTVGLGDALNRIGKRAIVCLREPSLGPCLGMKGGAAGGGYAQIVPMEDINLHFTGDLHAVTSAHNLLAALIDNHIHWGNALNLDVRRITWRRVMDMNDRALRGIVTALGGVANGFPRETGFDITVASEVMAVLCLTSGIADLERRLGNIVVGRTLDKAPVRAAALEAAGAMTVLLRDALMPNLVQTMENNPAIVHGGPFGNIAHGCNSVLATGAALKLGDYVVTEAGFGADLGAEKFFDIKCRKSGLVPDAAVIVATLRALKMHGGVRLEELDKENVEAVSVGFVNLARHIANVRRFGVPVVVAINSFAADTEAEFNMAAELCHQVGVTAVRSTHFAEGGKGATDLAEKVIHLAENAIPQFTLLYPDEMPLWEKAQTIARTIYGAEDIAADKAVRDQFNMLQNEGYGSYPICFAKTQYSFSTDPNLKGAPSGHIVPIRELRLAAGAEFIVAIAGDIMTMPGLPRVPAANRVGFDAEGNIIGLF
jgi:formate--tetrahydrofolate ligase